MTFALSDRIMQEKSAKILQIDRLTPPPGTLYAQNVDAQ
jgi:hypothetical protein